MSIFHIGIVGIALASAGVLATPQITAWHDARVAADAASATRAGCNAAADSYASSLALQASVNALKSPMVGNDLMEIADRTGGIAHQICDAGGDASIIQKLEADTLVTK